MGVGHGHGVKNLNEYASHRIIPTRTAIVKTNTLDSDFMKKTKVNQNIIPKTIKRKKTLNEDLGDDFQK